MSAVYLTLLLPALLAAVAMGAAVLLALRALRRQVAALRVAPAVPAIPAARTPEQAPAATDVEAALRRRAEIRKAVAEALAEERERELAEARAFWAAQEAREVGDAPLFDARSEESGEGPVYLSRQIDIAGFDGFPAAPLSAEARGHFDQRFTEALREAIDGLVREETAETGAGEAGMEEAGMEEASTHDPFEFDSDTDTDAGVYGAPRMAVPDMRRHPSHPAFRPSPAIADQARTTDHLEGLAADGTPLTDIRPGPLGTLDIYAFADSTTLCVTPGDRPATDRLAEALRSGENVLLMGGSGIGGAYTLTFSVGDDTVFVLADRVVASF